jgi:hypothetical protein
MKLIHNIISIYHTEYTLPESCKNNMEPFTIDCILYIFQKKKITTSFFFLYTIKHGSQVNYHQSVIDEVKM